MFIDSSLAAELIKVTKLRLMHPQFESNVILDDYKQYIKKQPLMIMLGGFTTELHS